MQTLGVAVTGDILPEAISTLRQMILSYALAVPAEYIDRLSLGYVLCEVLYI